MTSVLNLEIRSKSSWQNKAESILLWLSLFLMSWRMRYVIHGGEVQGIYVEYSSWHLYLTDLVLIALLLLWWVRKKDKVQWPPEIIHLPLFALLVWMTLSITWAEDKVTALMVAGRWWLFWGWFLYLINEVQNITKIVWPVAWGMLVQAGIGVVQYLANSSLGLKLLDEPVLHPDVLGVPVVKIGDVRQIRANGLMPHANILGGFLAVLVPLIVYDLDRVKKAMQRYSLWLVIGVSVLALVLSFSRAAWIGFGVAFILLIVRMRDKIKQYWSAVLITGGAFVIFLLSQYHQVFSRIVVTDSIEVRSIVERIDGWNYWQLLFAKSPVWGTGIGNYITGLIHLEPGQSGWWYQPVHSAYLLVAGELGLVGAILWLWLIVAAIWTSWKIWQRKKGIEFMLTLPFITLLVIGLFDHWVLSLQQGKLLIFFALALIILGFRVSLKENKT